MGCWGNRSLFSGLRMVEIATLEPTEFWVGGAAFLILGVTAWVFNERLAELLKALFSLLGETFRRRGQQLATPRRVLVAGVAFSVGGILSVAGGFVIQALG